ncbi:MAG: DMT family transporter [Rubrivivax sp.]
MSGRELAAMLALAALWGASFLFMRLGAADFGALPLSALRVGVATTVLLPLLWQQRQWSALRRHWRAIAIVGVVNSALPFVFFSVAALALNTGLSAILNAMAPLWGALIAWLWLGERLSGVRIAGLALGFAGVVWLVGDSASLAPGEHGVSAAVAIGACIAATLCYGFAANYTRRWLTGAPPLAVATGSQAAAALLLLLPAWWLWPSVTPPPAAWMSVAGLAIPCTALAYLLYFWLIARLGAARAISVTFLIPVFGMAWGYVFLGEPVTLVMLLCCAVVLAGTALASGVIGTATLARFRPRPSR